MLFRSGNTSRLTVPIIGDSLTNNLDFNINEKLNKFKLIETTKEYEFDFADAKVSIPKETFYKDFANSTIAEFILYWKETGQSHNSWNSKFLQHVKFQWQKYNQNQNAQGQNLMDKRSICWEDRTRSGREGRKSWAVVRGL